MTEILDYGLDTPARALLVLILSMDDRTKEKAMNKLHFQKAIYYFENLTHNKEVFFSNFKLGGVSFELMENMEILEESGLVTRIATKYILTPEGNRLAKDLAADYECKDPEALKKLRYAKYMLNDLNDKELLFFMYMTFPETQVNSTEFENLLQMKDTLVRRLFVRDRINSLTAAKWLGINQREFLESMKACD